MSGLGIDTFLNILRGRRHDNITRRFKKFCWAHNQQKSSTECIEKCSINNFPCHPELGSGSYRRQKISTIRTQKSNVGLKAQPTSTAFTLAEVFLPYYYSPRKAAFTLAEVLITLGIIGVVAAMTLPTLINQTQGKELEVRLKRAYTIIQSALNQMNYEQGYLATGKVYSTKTFMPVFSQYLKTMKNCGATGCESSSAVNEDTGELEYNRSETYRTYNNKPMATTLFDDGQFVTVDGMLFMIENETDTPEDNSLFISVDVNGQQNKPNKWGHDLFTFEILLNGKLLPMGAKGTTYENQHCSTTNNGSINGIGCTYKALTEKDYFKNLPK